MIYINGSDFYPFSTNTQNIKIEPLLLPQQHHPRSTFGPPACGSWVGPRLKAAHVMYSLPRPLNGSPNLHRL